MQFLLYLGINIIMAINPNKTQKDQADHSQVQSSEHEQGDLKSVKDSSTSNNPVHEYPSSTCQAVADINPASNSESISHSNPDEKKEIKEEAPSSNLAGCENEIVHSTNSENLSQI